VEASLACGISFGLGLAALGVRKEWIWAGGEAMLESSVCSFIGSMECMGIWGFAFGRVSDLGIMPWAFKSWSLAAGRGPVVIEHASTGAKVSLVGISRISGGLAGDHEYLGGKREQDRPFM